MEPSNPEARQSIAGGSRLCSDLLTRWTQATKDGSEESEHAADATFRFNLWARTNAAIAPGFESMDHRLRRAPVPLLVVTDLLRELAVRANGNP